MTKPYSYPDIALRMCLDCIHSRVYQASNNRNIWYFCAQHAVSTHYNESCEQYQRDDKELKIIHEPLEFLEKLNKDE